MCGLCLETRCLESCGYGGAGEGFLPPSERRGGEEGEEEGKRGRRERERGGKERRGKEREEGKKKEGKRGRREREGGGKEREEGKRGRREREGGGKEREEGKRGRRERERRERERRGKEREEGKRGKRERGGRGKEREEGKRGRSRKEKEDGKDGKEKRRLLEEGWMDGGGGISITRDQGPLLFGPNSSPPELYREFCKEIVLQEDSLEGVCNCFIANEAGFKVYVLFLLNSEQQGESILAEYGGSFFTDKQREVGDEEGVRAHYSKPRTRLVQYVETLKDLSYCAQKQYLHGVSLVKVG
jgi:hypothetical protein